MKAKPFFAHPPRSLTYNTQPRSSSHKAPGGIILDYKRGEKKFRRSAAPSPLCCTGEFSGDVIRRIDIAGQVPRCGSTMRRYVQHVHAHSGGSGAAGARSITRPSAAHSGARELQRTLDSWRGRKRKFIPRHARAMLSYYS